MIGVLDFGSAGNVRSVVNAFKRVGEATPLVSSYDAESSLTGLVVPGVGSFKVVPQIVAALGGKKGVAKIKIPVLGICLGMQALFEKSDESRGASGLSVVPGRVRKLNGGVRLPQLGWNRVMQRRSDPLLEGIKDGQYFYFANSYAPFPDDAESIVGSTTYGMEFASAVQKGNWWGVQFHPEKSGRDGLRMIANFINICRMVGK